ncbi:SulP family inorganic anion transporter [Gordonia sp. ABSL1-1]|uniref:SulP family inorganic anion transporter n=1 Tax=Gordonia sp. ABSL1-1 TaxID=3053923 RepID=UPI0025726FD1|nr:SulP family inorganic anion transporter [Gordonia sp. ABSL1-1]MDL9935336.1 SulP family inorganic anion transporter [Gordonia sp. ABSL1-1]
MREYPLPSRSTALRRASGRSQTLAALRNPRLLRVEVFAGLVTALALIPETISFSLVAGVSPAVGLFTSFIFAMTIAIVGGRRAMVSAAAGSVALVAAPMVRDHGVDYLVATVLLAGVLQVLLAAVGVAKLMRFIPHSVMTGFVNALAILIFSAQVPHLIGVPWLVYPMTAAGLVVMIVLPRITTVIPAPLIATAILTVIAVVGAVAIPRVGDEGPVDELPAFGLPDVPMELETLRIIAPYALAIAMVGLLESLITAKIVDELTDTSSDHRREGWGQGVANFTTGLFGGMGGCAMIGQTMMNVKTCGARTRISTFVAGASLLCMMAFFAPVLAAIPMAALVAVMVMVSVATMDWHSIAPKTLRRMPIGETITMLGTVGVTVATHNLAFGVLAGVLCAMVILVRRMAGGAQVESSDTAPAVSEPGEVDTPGHRTYRIRGHLFFAASNTLEDRFDFATDPPQVTIDFSSSHLWDATTVATLDAIRARYEALGKTVTFVGLNEPSAALHARLSGGFRGPGD